MRSRSTHFLVSLAATVLLLGLWWAITARPAPAPPPAADPRVAARGDLLVTRLGRRLGPLWTDDLTRPDLPPRSAAERLATYVVEENELRPRTGQKLAAAHRRAWNSVTRLLPPELTNEVSVFTLASDGRGSGRGWLMPRGDGRSWQLALDPRDSTGLGRLRTLTYQSAALLALGPRQIQPLPEGTPCATVTTSAGCVQPNTLLHRYVRTFWSDDLLREWRQRRVPSNPAQAAAFFQAHPETFLNESAAQGPEQDFALAWTAFVLGRQPKQTDTVAQRKVAFFFQDPELVALRLNLLRRASAALPATSKP